MINNNDDDAYEYMSNCWRLEVDQNQLRKQQFTDPQAVNKCIHKVISEKKTASIMKRSIS